MTEIRDISPAPTHPRPDAAGFTLIELVIVMVILAILMAVVIPQFGGAKNTSNRKALVSVMTTYKSAIDGYKLDHSGRAPTPGQPDWPTLNAGPLEVFNKPGTATRQPYMGQGIPEPVSSGRITMRTNGASAPLAKTSMGAIVYVQGATPTTLTTYALVAVVRQPGNADPGPVHSYCYMGNQTVLATAALPATASGGPIPTC